MTAISTTDFGPISTTPYNFVPSWTSNADPKGFRSALFSGDITIAQADQLSALVSNPAALRTIGGFTGVLEYISSNSPVTSSYNGYYLLQSFAFTPSRIGEDAKFSGFSMTAIYLGDLA